VKEISAIAVERLYTRWKKEDSEPAANPLGTRAMWIYRGC